MAAFPIKKPLLCSSLILALLLPCLGYWRFALSNKTPGPLTYRQREQLLGDKGLRTNLRLSNSPITLSTDDLWQTGPYCGANCLYVWLRLLDKDVKHASILSKVPTDENGASLLDLKKVVHTYGFTDVDIYQILDADLPYVKRPFVALLKSTIPHETVGHFVVVCKVDDHQVSAVDGTSANYDTMARDTFRQGFSGYVLTEGIAERAGSSSWHGLSWVVFALFVSANVLYSAARWIKGTTGKGRAL